eukprot:78896-Rhodomonas_salina.1
MLRLCRSNRAASWLQEGAEQTRCRCRSRQAAPVEASPRRSCRRGSREEEGCEKGGGGLRGLAEA